MGNQPHNSSFSGHGKDKAVKFPGAQARVPKQNGNVNGDGEVDGAIPVDKASDSFQPALGNFDSAIIDNNSVEFRERLAELERTDSSDDSSEVIRVAPEPQLDWAALEEKQSEREDNCATVSSASIVAEIVEGSESTDSIPNDNAADNVTSGEIPARVSSDKPSDTAPKDSESSAKSGSSERSFHASKKSGDQSSSSSFPGAVATPSTETALVEPELPLSPWYKRIPTWKQTLCSSTIAVIAALVVLWCSMSYLRVLPNEESSSLGIFSEVLSSVFTQGTGERVFQGKDRLNILCLGIDYNRDERGMGYTAGARSDTMFVLSVNPEGSILNVLSIPRDMQVYINDYIGYDKINAAYSVGGIELSKRVVSRFLGIPIDRYIIIKVAGAAKMVDAVGGLQIDVEKDMDYDDNWGQLHIHLRAGNQLLQGEQAVGYARFRMDEESDRGRIRRQQQTMQALVQRLKDPMVILRLQAIMKAIKENIITDLSVLDMLDLAYLYKDFDRQHMKTGTLVGDDAEVNGASVIIPYEPENRKIVAELFSDLNNISRSEVRLEVLNGSGDNDLVAQVAEMLTQEGFQVTTGVADRDDYQVTRVIDHLGMISMRTALENLLRGCQYEMDEMAADKRKFDITIIVGQDRQRVRSSSSVPTTIYVDNGSANSKDYVDDGQGLRNDRSNMPFDDIQESVNSDEPSSSSSSSDNAYVEPNGDGTPVRNAPQSVAVPAHEANVSAPLPEPEPLFNDASSEPVAEPAPVVEAEPEPEPAEVLPNADEEVLPDQVTL